MALYNLHEEVLLLFLIGKNRLDYSVWGDMHRHEALEGKGFNSTLPLFLKVDWNAILDAVILPPPSFPRLNSMCNNIYLLALEAKDDRSSRVA